MLFRSLVRVTPNCECSVRLIDAMIVFPLLMNATGILACLFGCQAPAKSFLWSVKFRRDSIAPGPPWIAPPGQPSLGQAIFRPRSILRSRCLEDEGVAIGSRRFEAQLQVNESKISPFTRRFAREWGRQRQDASPAKRPFDHATSHPWPPATGAAG